MGAFDRQGSWAATMKTSGRSNAAALHGDKSDDGLEGGTRGIGAADGAVDEGFHRVVS